MYLHQALNTEQVPVPVVFPQSHTSFPRLGSELRNKKVVINSDTGIMYTEPHADQCTDYLPHGMLLASDFPHLKSEDDNARSLL